MLTGRVLHCPVLGNGGCMLEALLMACDRRKLLH